jgi:hypothetical protein
MAAVSAEVKRASVLARYGPPWNCVYVTASPAASASRSAVRQPSSRSGTLAARRAPGSPEGLAARHQGMAGQAARPFSLLFGCIATSRVKEPAVRIWQSDV